MRHFKMRRAKAARKAIIEDSTDSEDEIPLKKPNVTPENKCNTKDDSSSSESDIENYLHHPDKLDLSSEFFNIKKKVEPKKFESTSTSVLPEFNTSEEEFSGFEGQNVDKQDNENQLSVPVTSCHRNIQKTRRQEFNTSEEEFSGFDNKDKDNKFAVPATHDFKQMQDFNKKLQEAKKHVEEYNARKKADDLDLNVTDLLTIGESKILTLENITADDLHSSDFESSGDEWEEVEHKASPDEEDKDVIPKHDVQVIVDPLPDTHKKKKDDFLMAIKRRLNRIRKENQVLIHKVHLLCWIAHGNYVNSVINDSKILATALSLLPSNKCYPADRTDLGYLEQILQWYRKTFDLVETGVGYMKKMDLLKGLQVQLEKKKAYNKNSFTYIFVAILRALGIQCRLVLSFQVEPLRPPVSELHSLSKSSTDAKSSKAKVSTAKKTQEKSEVKNAKKDGSATKSASQDKARGANKKVQDIKSKGVSWKDSVVEGSQKISEKLSSDNKTGVSVKVNSPNLKNEKQSHTISKKLKNLRPLSVKGTTKSTRTESINEETSVRTNKGSQRVSEKTKAVQDQPSQENVKIKDDTITESRRRSKSASDLKLKTSNPQNAKGKTDSKEKEKCLKVEQRSQCKSANDTEAQNDKKTDPNISKKKKQSREIIKIKLPKGDRNQDKKILQVDGINDTFEEKEIYSIRRVDENEHLALPYTIPQLDGNSADETPPKKPSRAKINISKLKSSHRSESSVSSSCSPNKPSTSTDYNSEDDFSPSPSSKKFNFAPIKGGQMDVRSDIIGLIKKRISEQKQVDRSKKVNKRKPTQSDSDSDYAPEPVKKKRHSSDSDLEYFAPKPKVKQRIRVKRDPSGKIVSSSSDDVDESGKKKSKGINVWVEVFLEMEEKWISADVIKGQVHCVDEIYKRATHPVTYIVAWNNDNTIKDVTRRYCKNFATVTRKLRVDEKWWEETLTPFTGEPTAKDKEEDDDMNRQLLDQPLPKSIAEYKNHPLYALKRHLLKFEAIYPPDIVPLGFVRGEAVYPRNSVYVCRSRDVWLKEAKVVRPGEKPYKIVKARPKWDKLSNSVIKDQMLEIFGPWQTMDYEPPTAENGVVPRNAFGNVELFKPCMLPKGCVHLRLPGLNKICRRLDIDCATAIVGFDFHCGGSVPSYDGFVVCEEYADQLVAAWELEQEEIERRENEKAEKRVYGHWKRLIKGLLIREKLNQKYDFGQTEKKKKDK